MTQNRTRTTLLLALLVAAAALAFGGFVGSANATNYCDPLAGCANVKASPSNVKAGSVTKIYGTTGGCRQITLYSKAFKGSKHNFAGVPAVYVKAAKSGSFSTKIRISRSVKAGKYGVGGRCGGGHFGSTTLKVHH